MVDGVISVRRSPFLGGFGWILLIGLGMVAVATLLAFVMDVGELPSSDVVPALLRGFGILAVCTGLAGAGLFAKELAIPVRVALLIAGTYFLVSAAGLSSLLRALL
jgi:hypothetical protein